jgi:hypothetical protein
VYAHRQPLQICFLHFDAKASFSFDTPDILRLVEIAAISIRLAINLSYVGKFFSLFRLIYRKLISWFLSRITKKRKVDSVIEQIFFSGVSLG